MANSYLVDWSADQLITEIKDDHIGISDDSFWGKFEDSTRKIEFTEELLGFIASKLNVESVKASQLVAHGTQNSHYLLEDSNGKKYILRMGGDGLEIEAKKGQRIVDEFNKLKILQDIAIKSDGNETENVGFHVFFMDDSKKFAPYGYFVGDYIEGNPLNFGENLSDELVIQLARLLKKIHSVDKKCLEQEGYPTEMFMTEPRDKIFPDVCEGAEQILPDNLYQRTYDATLDVIPLVLKSPIGLTHGDFHVANMMETESGVRAVDWEMSHIGCQILDVVNFTHSGGISPPPKEQVEMFMKEYGYGGTFEEKLVLWYFSVKISVLGVWFLKTSDTFGKLPGMDKMVGVICEALNTLLANKPQA